MEEWLQTPVTPDRVISVVAAGGTGKTALVHDALGRATLSDRAGVLVWSFYEDPHTDAFLRAAYLYFTGDKDAPSGGMLERLQIALSGDLPHVLILDGLERVQSEGGTHRRGELEDLLLKRLVRALAGGKGSARALVTSRFPLVDLEQFTGAGHRAILLDDLELSVALDVLRAWKVNGDDARLKQLIEPLNIGGTYHALSVAALGSYLGNFAGGDPNRAPEFSLDDTKDADPKSRRLFKILDQYQKALSPVERDLLARLSLFPRGVKVELLGWIVQSGGQVAGALIGLKDRDLVNLLERLKELGLVFRYETDRQVFYSAHPFLRDFFRRLLETDEKSVHESVRSHLAPSLEARPEKKPSDRAILEQYELLIEQTLLSGRVQDAWDLYWYGLGGYVNLGWVLGENTLALRILERFVPQDRFSLIEPYLSVRVQSVLVAELCLFASELGDLDRARRGFSHCRRLAASLPDWGEESQTVVNLADGEFFAGCLPRALEYAEIALSLATEAEDVMRTKNSLVYRASVRFALGDVATVVTDFERATELEQQPLYGERGIREAECKLLRGDRSGAVNRTQANRKVAIDQVWNADLCRCNALLAGLVLSDNPSQAAGYLEEARAFAERSGSVDCQLRCFHSACELQRHLGDYPQSIAEAEAGIVLADGCGFGKYSIDLRLALAETCIAAGDAHKALQNARNALDRSEHPDCQYAWGQADGLHFCGVAHQRLGERELARQRLAAALKLREKLGHGRIEETRRALELVAAADH